MQAKIDFLYTNIGRGHPHYLDGIVEQLPPDRVGIVTDVFAAPSSRTRFFWKAVRAAYYAGAMGGALSGVYNQVRSRLDYGPRNPSHSLLRRGLSDLLPEQRPLVVAHPLLVALLRGREDLVYQHGEVVVPSESFVVGKHLTIVPLSQIADRFRAAGCPKDRVFVSGLCVEPSLVGLAERSMNARSTRIRGSEQLCGAFFSSGAEPKRHVDTIATAARDVHGKGGCVVVFAQRSGRLEKKIRATYGASGLKLTDVEINTDLSNVESRTFLCLFENRADLNKITARLFADFDYFVAPPHERTSWALGMGIPMFLLDPPIGAFAPLNRKFLIEAGVAKPIPNRVQSQSFGEIVDASRRCGELEQMAKAGWQRFDIQGFSNISAMLEVYD